MITVNNLTFGYKGRPSIFKNISFYLDAGEILSIMGPNGTGKTTLLKNISGVYEPTQGSCTIDKVKGHKAKLSYVPQAKKIHLSYNVLDFVSFGCSQNHSYFASPKKEDYDHAEEILNYLDMAYLIPHNVNQISGGELQMCYLAKALVSDPDILICDEPESNLDFKNQFKVINILHDLSKKGVTIIFNTHFLNYAKRISDKSLLMSKDSYLFGTKNDIFKEDILEKYLKVPIKKCNYTLSDNQTNEVYIVV